MTKEQAVEILYQYAKAYIIGRTHQMGETDSDKRARKNIEECKKVLLEHFKK